MLIDAGLSVGQFVHDLFVASLLAPLSLNSLISHLPDVFNLLRYLIVMLLSLLRWINTVRFVHDLLHVDIVLHLGALGRIRVQRVVTLVVKERAAIYIGLNILVNVLLLLSQIALG